MRAIKVIAVLGLVLASCVAPHNAHAATGCLYPASLDTFADKSAGDFLTVADVNEFRCAIEKLESGPLRPNVGSVSAPAVGFQGRTTTGLYSSAADTLDFAVGGVRGLQVTSVASAVNYLSISPHTAGNGPSIIAAGASADIPLALSPKGIGTLQLRSNQNAAFVVGRQTANPAANYWIANANETGAPPTLAVEGPDANINMIFSTKGTGVHAFYNAGGTGEAARIVDNGLQFTLNASGLTSSSFGIHGDSADALLLSVPTDDDVIALRWNGATGMAFLKQNGAGGIQCDEASADFTAAPANTARLYCRDNGGGKTQFVVRFPTGAVQVIATEP